MTQETSFHYELTALLNKFSKENASNTPHFILANHLEACLKNFNQTMKSREKYYSDHAETPQSEADSMEGAKTPIKE